jgi:BolA family transcriptional regulator, general stress-responsive regulator
MGVVAEAIRRKLVTAFSPERLEVVDASDRHRGHAGADRPGYESGGGETHFDVVIVAAAFEGLGRVERQRRVNAALAEELAGPVHALSIQARTPAEAR